MSLTAFNRVRREREVRKESMLGVPLSESENEDVDESITNYNSMSDDDLAVVAMEKGISTDGMTRRQVLNAIKKAV